MKNSWSYSKFSSIFLMATGNSINEEIKRSKYLNATSGLPYYSTADIANSRELIPVASVRILESDAKSFKVAEPGSVLLCIEGGSAGRKIAQTYEKCHFGNKILSIYSSEPVTNKFAFYFMQTEEFINDFKRAQTGLIGGVSLNKMKEFVFPNPPKEEKYRIVSKLDEMLGLLGEVRANTVTSKMELDSLWQQSLRNAFVFDAPIKSLDDICLKITDGSHNPPKGIGKSPFLMLSAKDVLDDFVSTDSARFLSKENFEIENRRTQVSDGDVLLTIVGTIGRVAVASNLKNITFQRSVAVLRPIPEIVNPRFLMYYLVSMRREIESKATGTAQKGIYLGQLKSLTIKLPSISEQTSIVQRLDELKSSIDRQHQVFAEKELETSRLRSAILSTAFKGELK